MWEDPIVEEIHKTRAKIASEHNYDVRALIKHYQEKQRERGRKTVSRVTKPLSTQPSSANPEKPRHKGS